VRFKIGDRQTDELINLLLFLDASKEVGLGVNAKKTNMGTSSVEILRCLSSIALWQWPFLRLSVQNIKCQHSTGSL
jgi:hypothetical protein